MSNTQENQLTQTTWHFAVHSNPIKSNKVRPIHGGYPSMNPVNYWDINPNRFETVEVITQPFTPVRQRLQPINLFPEDDSDDDRPLTRREQLTVRIPLVDIDMSGDEMSGEEMSYGYSEDESTGPYNGAPSFNMLHQERYGFTSQNAVIAIKHIFNGRELYGYFEWDPDTETPENLMVISEIIMAATDVIEISDIFEESSDPNIPVSDLENDGFIFISDGSPIENGGVLIDMVWNTRLIEISNNLVHFIHSMDNITDILSDLIATQVEMDDLEEFDDLEDIPIRLTDTEYKQVINVLSSSEIKSEQSGCSICQDNFTGNEKCHVIECGHAYHGDCLKRWLCETCQIPTCPNCRYDSRENLEKKEKEKFSFTLDEEFDLKSINFWNGPTDGLFVFGRTETRRTEV